jgi:hypothetical protein
VILGTGECIARAVRHGREAIEDRAAAVNEGIGERAHVGSIRNVVDNVVGIDLVSLVLGHRSLLETEPVNLGGTLRSSDY